MIAVILAAGQGLRLGKLTEDKPRCLLEIGGRSILDRQLEQLAGCGINKDDVCIVAGYRAELVQSKYDNVVVNKRYYDTDNSYSLGLALKHCENADTDGFIIIDGDLIFDKDAIAQVVQSKFKNVVAVKKSSDEIDSTGVIFDKNGIVSNIGKHIKDSEYIYTGIMKISKEYAAELSDIMLSEQNRKKWYTVPMNDSIALTEVGTVCISSMVNGINNYFEYIKAKELLGEHKCTIMVTGASGFLGRKICAILGRDYKIVKLSNQQKDGYSAVDLCNQSEVSAVVEINKPDIIIHTAAIADPDVCEKDNTLAYNLNVKATEILCDICTEKNIKMIHISTDYVFSGDDDGECFENSKREPKSYYGHTKCLAEDAVAKVSEHLIVRIPIIYGFNDISDKKTFPTKTIESLRNGENIYLDNVQIRYPVLIDEVATAISSFIAEKGILQISSGMGVTKYRWAMIIAESFGLDKKLIHPTDEKTPANRPLHVKLNTDRLDSKNVKISDVDKGIDIVRKQMSCVFKLIYKSNGSDNIYGVNVGNFRYNMGKMLVRSLPKELTEKIDCVVPVPTSGIYYAIGAAEEMKKPYIQGLNKTDTKMRSFDIADIGLRESKIKSKILPIKELVENKKIMLIDEAIFTGTTLRIVCDMLKACNVKEIHICIPTPVSFFRCMQYVQPDRELLSESFGADELANYFRVDSVNYIPYHVFKEQLTNIECSLCYECFSKQEE